MILLPLPPKCWDYRHALCLAYHSLFKLFKDVFVFKRVCAHTYPLRSGALKPSRYSGTGVTGPCELPDLVLESNSDPSEPSPQSYNPFYVWIFFPNMSNSLPTPLLYYTHIHLMASEQSEQQLADCISNHSNG